MLSGLALADALEESLLFAHALKATISANAASPALMDDPMTSLHGWQ
jgi:hypothetical protein